MDICPPIVYSPGEVQNRPEMHRRCIFQYYKAPENDRTDAKQCLETEAVLIGRVSVTIEKPTSNSRAASTHQSVDGLV